MKVLRGVLGGIAFGIISEAFGWLVYGALFMKWTENAGDLWRPMDSLYWKVGVPLADILSGLMIAVGYAVFYKGIPGTGIKKGLVFGATLWLIMRFAGELFWYTMSPIPFMLVVAGWIHGLLAMLIGGVVLAAIYGKSLD